jgi:hypothetical protein
MQISTYNTWIVIISTLIFFAMSLLITAGTGKQVQDGYWKIAVLRKLTVIQKNLELNNELLKKSQRSQVIPQKQPEQIKAKPISKPEGAKHLDNSKRLKILKAPETNV